MAVVVPQLMVKLHYPEAIEYIISLLAQAIDIIEFSVTLFLYLRLNILLRIGFLFLYFP